MMSSPESLSGVLVGFILMRFLVFWIIAELPDSTDNMTGIFSFEKGDKEMTYITKKISLIKYLIDLFPRMILPIYQF